MCYCSEFNGRPGGDGVDVCTSAEIGEMACGNLRNREELLRLLNDLPQTPVASPAEVLHFIECNQLMGLAVVSIDIHPLAATALAEDAMLRSANT